MKKKSPTRYFYVVFQGSSYECGCITVFVENKTVNYPNNRELIKIIWSKFPTLSQSPLITNIIEMDKDDFEEFIDQEEEKKDDISKAGER